MGFKRPEVQIFSPRPAIIYIVYYEIGRSGHPLRSFFAVFHPENARNKATFSQNKAATIVTRLHRINVRLLDIKHSKRL